MKKLIMTIAIATMFAAPAMAQVFLDEDENGNRANGGSQLVINNPAVYDSGEDWFAPVGEGMLLLAGLAGAYLVGKRRKEE